MKVTASTRPTACMAASPLVSRLTELHEARIEVEWDRLIHVDQCEVSMRWVEQYVSARRSSSTVPSSRVLNPVPMVS